MRFQTRKTAPRATLEGRVDALTTFRNRGGFLVMDNLNWDVAAARQMQLSSLTGLSETTDQIH